MLCFMRTQKKRSKVFRDHLSMSSQSVVCTVHLYILALYKSVSHIYLIYQYVYALHFGMLQLEVILPHNYYPILIQHVSEMMNCIYT